MMTAQRSLLAFLAIATFSLMPANARGQVLEATLYGIVQDSSGGALPGVTVTVTHQGTTLTRDTVSEMTSLSTRPSCSRVSLRQSSTIC